MLINVLKEERITITKTDKYTSVEYMRFEINKVRTKPHCTLVKNEETFY